MSEQARLLNALKASGIQRVAVVDDAFDVPEIAPDAWGQVREHLATPALAAAVKEDIHLGPLLAPAIAAIEEGEYESDDLTQFVERLYDRYARTREPMFDPGKVFSEKRGPALDGIKPIFDLLNKADPAVEVIRVGSVEDEEFAANIANIDLMFVDFFLDPLVTSDVGPDEPVSTEAKNRSQHMIREIIKKRGKTPAIILMSSQDVAARTTDFRKDLGRKYLAARFQFIEKDQLTSGDNGDVRIENPAADTILDILQCFKFGDALASVVDLWEVSAMDAVGTTIAAVSELELRDFAYLIRFRLEKEGQELIEYLEWLLGEFLVDETGRRFYSATKEEPRARTVSEAQSAVEGAFEGQSEAVAKIYHRVRVENPRVGKQPSLRMGDLFLSPGKNRISAVITPDCDLVVRDKKPAAKRVTLVHGNIKPFNRANTSADSFILIDDAPKNIQWSKKDIETREFGWPKDESEATFLGTLRPLYAQQLQRAVLHDFGRVGLATWPALGLSLDVELLYFNESGQPRRLTIPKPLSTCTVIPRRPDGPPDEKHMVVFTRPLMRKVRELLGGLELDKVVEIGREHVQALMGNDADAELVEAGCHGVALESKLAHNILVTKGDDPGTGGWCWLAVRVT